MLSLTPDEWERLHLGVLALIESTPTFDGVRSRRLNDDELRWIARLRAILRRLGDVQGVIELDNVQRYLTAAQGSGAAIGSVRALLFRAYGETELYSPSGSTETFVAVGNKFDAITGIKRILDGAEDSVIFIDPYADQSLLTDFAVQARENLRISILADNAFVKEGLRPAAQAWRRQYTTNRELSVRLSAPKTLHDRAILVDWERAIIVTQSFKDLADRSPATISTLSPESAALKIAHYRQVWDQSAPI